MLTLRPAAAADLPAINAIYNHYVLNSTATYQTAPSTDAQRAVWFAAHAPRHPILVADRLLPSGQREIIGWGSLSPFHPREAFARSVENSVYIHPQHLRKGHGRSLLAELIVQARALHHHVIVAIIDSEQSPSITLHARQGFVEVGRLRQVGFKFDRWLDAIYMQLTL